MRAARRTNGHSTAVGTDPASRWGDRRTSRCSARRPIPASTLRTDHSANPGLPPLLPTACREMAGLLHDGIARDLGREGPEAGTRRVSGSGEAGLDHRRALDHGNGTEDQDEPRNDTEFAMGCRSLFHAECRMSRDRHASGSESGCNLRAAELARATGVFDSPRSAHNFSQSPRISLGPQSPQPPSMNLF
jgi:hypothetical protein